MARDDDEEGRPELSDQVNIGIVGSRRRVSLLDRTVIREFLERCLSHYVDREVVVVSGGCPRGADRFAEESARLLGIRTIVHPVVKPGDPPVLHRGDFRERAFARNELIARDSDVLFALVHHDRTGGTENTVRHAIRLGKTVFVVDDTGLLYLQKGGRGSEEDAARDTPGQLPVGQREDDTPQV